MVRRPLRYVLAATFALTGCSALLDVKDIYFDPNASAANGDGGPDGTSMTEGGRTDGGADSQSCATDTMTDVMNCGRCSHRCLGGACTAGVCQAVELASVAAAPLEHVAVSDLHVFTSTSISLTSEVGGIWRTAKAGGVAELYASLRYAESMVVLGDKLYFVVDDNPAGSGADTGGFYSCPVAGPAPCAPTLIAASKLSRSITIDKTKVVYGDAETGKGLMTYTPGGGAPTVFRDGYGFSGNSVVDGNVAFYTTTISASPQRAKVIEILPDGGFLERYAYESDNANAGRLIADTDSLFFTAYDYMGTTGGVVRRLPRTGGAPCDLGGSANKRPYGIYADSMRVYWSNQGEGASAPYTNGSVVSCEQTGCCTTPKTLWTGDGEPKGVAGDADAIYFVTRVKGSIWKIAKP